MTSKRALRPNETSISVVPFEPRNSMPTASDLKIRAAKADADRLTEILRRKAVLEVEIAKLLLALSRHSVGDIQAVNRFAALMQQAITNEFSEIAICRFRFGECSDGGDTIRAGAEGWEATLVGLPKDAHQFWERHLKPRGYKLRIRSSPFDETSEFVRMSIDWE